MKQADVDKIATIVSERVLKAMQAFVTVLEGVVRENEELRAKVDMLEMRLYEHGEYQPGHAMALDGFEVDEETRRWTDHWGPEPESFDPDEVGEIDVEDLELEYPLPPDEKQCDCAFCMAQLPN